MRPHTMIMLGLTPYGVKALAMKYGKMPEPLTEKGVNQLCREKAAAVVKRSMQKARAKK